MEIPESRLVFVFGDKYDVVKHDDSVFYKRYFTKLPHGKGVDMIADSADEILLIEVKNCSSYESTNRWRTAVGKTVPTVDGQIEESFDIEISKKVSMSLSCLYGAYTKTLGCPSAEELSPYFNKMISRDIVTNKRPLRIIFFLEGEFGSITRTKKMIMERIQDSIKEKLSWLNCIVQVVDSNTHAGRHFTVKRANT